MSETKRAYVRPMDLKNGVIDMTHGAGGRATAQLISEVFAKAFDNAYLNEGHDGATLPTINAKLVMSCDGHVVEPLEFPGGDIGRLAVCGTVNDVAVCAAKPKYLSASFILEEGLPLKTLVKVVESMKKAADEAGVAIVTGDTKVVEKGHGDGIFIATTGVGEKLADISVAGQNAQAGDAVLVSGTMGDHGITILSHREGLSFGVDLQSDCAPLNTMVENLITQFGDKIHVLRDPTRGGLATTLNEIAAQSQVGIVLDEETIPIKDSVVSACEFLGLDPLYIANEGKLIVICQSDVAEDVLQTLHEQKYGTDAALVGHVTQDNAGMVEMKTALGGTRLVDWLNSDPLPRIC